jgi:hypothetical protein
MIAFPSLPVRCCTKYTVRDGHRMARSRDSTGRPIWDEDTTGGGMRSAIDQPGRVITMAGFPSGNNDRPRNEIRAHKSPLRTPPSPAQRKIRRPEIDPGGLTTHRGASSRRSPRKAEDTRIVHETRRGVKSPIVQILWFQRNRDARTPPPPDSRENPDPIGGKARPTSRPSIPSRSRMLAWGFAL